MTAGGEGFFSLPTGAWAVLTVLAVGLVMFIRALYDGLRK